ncbi:MAG: CocE/NonD family hydrolase [Actinomycetota bacterium]
MCRFATRAALIGIVSLLPAASPASETTLGARARVDRLEQQQVCSHPDPCGYRWKGPSGPFQVSEGEQVKFESFDGVELSGWVWRPEVKVPVPVVLISTPYLATGSIPSEPPAVGGLPGEEFVKEGYAVAIFSVRGTGDSSGCFGFKSESEQRDQKELVEWLAEQEWSNGRVGMIGLSYYGTTPVMAAIQNPSALKTIVIAGTILDEYNFIHTPQGAQFFEGSGVGPAFSVQYSLAPALTANNGSEERFATTAERLCEEQVAVNTVVPAGEARGQRDPAYWEERRFIDRVPDIRAATFVVHGFLDRWGSGHAFQDDWAWRSLRSAPKRMLLGQWWHEWPHQNFRDVGSPRMSEKEWKTRLLAWFDYWLKGRGKRAPGLGEVDFQDSSGAWHTTNAWPPPTDRAKASMVRVHDEVVYLRAGEITPNSGDESSSFVSVTPAWRGGTDPDFTSNANGWRFTTPCPDPTRLVYLTEPTRERTVLAGNAFAWLKVGSSAPGGLFELQLYDMGPDFACGGPPQVSDDLRPLTEGAVDLQFHASEDYQAHPFPVDEPTHVRVDLANLSEVLEPEHRLALVISHGVYYRWASAHDFFPMITMYGDETPQASHLVLPVLAGGFGGRPPTIRYPARPFLPKCCRD